jgi:hypothetical protein
MSKARQLADLGNQVDDGAITGTNMVVNGGMTVAQRGTSFVSPASGDWLLDRVVYQHTGSTAIITSTQESDGVVGVSPKSFKAQITTAANASPSANCFTQFVYYFEGNDVDHLGLGTSSCKPITLSFYIKCSTTGTLPIGVSNDGTRSFPATYNVTEANVWQRHIIKIPAVTDGSWSSGINRGLELRLGLEYGSDYTGGTANEWNSTVGYANFTTTYTNPVASTLNATWQITGLCLNVGDSAIDFPHESYGDTLAKCQRYYQRITNPSGDYGFVGSGLIASSAILARCGVPLKQNMRAAPTASYTNLHVYDGSGVYVVSTFTAYSLKDNFAFDAAATGLLANRGGVALIGTVAGSYFALDAEL